jgi:hypothetical protein
MLLEILSDLLRLPFSLVFLIISGNRPKLFLQSEATKDRRGYLKPFLYWNTGLSMNHCTA